MTTTWLPTDWEHPLRVDLPTGHHLRPITADDTEKDMQAVMGSRERLWAIYGDAWGWPPADMSAEADREDLQRHWEEMQTHGTSTSAASSSPRWTPSSPTGSPATGR